MKTGDVAGYLVILRVKGNTITKYAGSREQAWMTATRLSWALKEVPDDDDLITVRELLLGEKPR